MSLQSFAACRRARLVTSMGRGHIRSGHKAQRRESQGRPLCVVSVASGVSCRALPCGPPSGCCQPGSVRSVKWPYTRRIDPAHAWGVVAVGTALLVAIPTILATLHASDSQFLWWWPTDWMVVPLAIFLAGAGLLVVPVRRPEQPAQAPATAAADATSVVGVRDDGDGDALRKPIQPSVPVQAGRSRATPEVEIGQPDASDADFIPPVRSVVHVRVREPISDLTACYVTDQALGGTTDVGHAAFHVSTGAWRIRSDHLLRSVNDVIIGYTVTENGRMLKRFQWGGHDRQYDPSAPGADGSHLSALHQIKQALQAGRDAECQPASTTRAQIGSQPMPAASEVATAGSRPPRPFPALLTQRTIPLSDGLHAGTMLAIEVRAHRELTGAAVLATGISGPAGAATIPAPARLYWHPARRASTTISEGASGFISVARTGPLPPGALMDSPDQELPWTLPDGDWRLDLQLTATGFPAMAITATFTVSPADGFPVQRLDWLTLTTPDDGDAIGYFGTLRGAS
jgi:hypothetical protein